MLVGTVDFMRFRSAGQVRCRRARLSCKLGNRFRISSDLQRLEEFLEAEKRGLPTTACWMLDDARLDCQERKGYLPQIWHNYVLDPRRRKFPHNNSAETDQVTNYHRARNDPRSKRPPKWYWYGTTERGQGNCMG